MIVLFISKCLISDCVIFYLMVAALGVGIWSIYGPFKRIPKQHVAGWYCPILLVQANGQQFKYWSTFHALNGAAKRWGV